MSRTPVEAISSDEALEAIVAALRDQLEASGAAFNGVAYHHADLWVPHMVKRFWRTRGVNVDGQGQGIPLRDRHYVPFYDAAWELCRCGVLRPGERSPQGMSQGSAAYVGDGFSLTMHGRAWIASDDRRQHVAPGRLAELLTPIAGRFGPGFLPRVSEAAGCYRSGHHMAACAMAGAAVECILLAIASAKLRDPARVMREYLASGGRKRTLGTITGSLRPELRGVLETLSGSLSYWRDGAAHGVETRIGEVQASHALDQLLRLAQLADSRWGELTDGGAA